MGKPAARLTDMHVCPMVTGVVPHVGGPISGPCAPNVLIGSLPAARITDMAVCVGPPDAIALGSPTVLIGGLMAARIGDPTLHGGVIVSGQPNVLIGELGPAGGGPGAALALPAFVPISPECAELADAAAKAGLADAVYGKPGATVPAGYQQLDPTTPDGRAALAELGISPSDLGDPGDTFKAAIFQTGTPQSPEYVVAYRGTQSGGDWWENAKQGVGAESEDYSKSIALAQKMDTATDGRVSFVGHSKGGGQASAAAIATGRPATTFNSAGAHTNSTEDFPDSEPAVKAYYVEGEVLSRVQDNRGAVQLGIVGLSALASPLIALGLGAKLLIDQVRGKGDLPKAYGDRLKLKAAPPRPDAPDGMIDKHGMDWVKSSIDAERSALGCMR